MTTLVIDTGQDIVGVFCVEDGNFVAYRGEEIQSAIRRIATADEVVTYNGKGRDLYDLGALFGLTGELPLKGIHTDMRSVCWSDRIFGSSLDNTYAMHFTKRPIFSDPPHERSCHLDVYMTFKLWELWKLGNLKVLDGHRVFPA
jgi:hypothetical protein